MFITGICYVYGILSYPRLRFYFALRQCKYKGPLPLRYCTLLVLYLMPQNTLKCLISKYLKVPNLKVTDLKILQST